MKRNDTLLVLFINILLFVLLVVSFALITAGEVKCAQKEQTQEVVIVERIMETPQVTKTPKIIKPMPIEEEVKTPLSEKPRQPKVQEPKAEQDTSEIFTVTNESIDWSQVRM